LYSDFFKFCKKRKLLMHSSCRSIFLVILCLFSAWAGADINRPLNANTTGPFRIKNINSGDSKCLGIADRSIDTGALANQWDCAAWENDPQGAKSQSWYREPVAENSAIPENMINTYRLVNLNSGQCLSVSVKGLSGEGKYFHQAGCGAESNQLFRFEWIPNPNKSVAKIHPSLGPFSVDGEVPLCLGVADRRTDNLGVPNSPQNYMNGGINQWTCVGFDSSDDQGFNSQTWLLQ
jgi:hypothetical protein